MTRWGYAVCAVVLVSCFPKPKPARWQKAPDAFELEAAAMALGKRKETTSSRRHAVGDHVEATWKDGKNYPGRISAIRGKNLDVQFDDGDRSTDLRWLDAQRDRPVVDCNTERDPDLAAFCKLDCKAITHADLKAHCMYKCGDIKDADFQTFCKAHIEYRKLYANPTNDDTKTCAPSKSNDWKMLCWELRDDAAREARARNSSGGGGGGGGAPQGGGDEENKNCKPAGARTSDMMGGDCCSGFADTINHPDREDTHICK